MTQAKRNPNLGISVSRTFKPGDVISMPTGHGVTTVYGHVGAVVDVDKKTGVITIVERNYAGQHFNVRQMQPSEYAGTYALDFSKATRKKKP